jgi:hypothetical protein
MTVLEQRQSGVPAQTPRQTRCRALKRHSRSASSDDTAIHSTQFSPAPSRPQGRGAPALHELMADTGSAKRLRRTSGGSKADLSMGAE